MNKNPVQEGSVMDILSKLLYHARRAKTVEEAASKRNEVLKRFGITKADQRAPMLLERFKTAFEEACRERAEAKDRKEIYAKRKAQIVDSRERKVAAVEVDSPPSQFRILDEKECPPYKKGDLESFDWCVNRLAYEGRINVVLGREEVKTPFDDGWIPVSDDVYRAIFKALGANFEWDSGHDEKPNIPMVWSAEAKKDAYVPWVHFTKFNPFADYILSLPPFDGVERIKKSMEMGGMAIYTGEEDHAWTQPIKDWAQSVLWLDSVRLGIFPGSQRYAELVLIGKSGHGKSQFPFRILPEHLRTEYFSDGSTNIDDGDKVKLEQGATLIGENTEFGGGYKRDWNKAKQMVLKREYKARVAYGAKSTLRPRADTVVHTTNEPCLPDDDPAVHRRLISVKVEGRVDADADNGIVPFHYLDEVAGEHDGKPYTVRDMCWAEAWHIIQNCDQKHYRRGYREAHEGLACDFNPMPSEIASDEEGLMAHNKRIGASYATAGGDTGEALREVLDWLLRNPTKGERVGAVYYDDGRLAGIERRPMHGLLYFAQQEHSDMDGVASRVRRVVIAHDEQADDVAPERNSNDDNDRREAMSKRAMRINKRFVLAAGMFRESPYIRRLPGLPDSPKQRWFEYVGEHLTEDDRTAVDTESDAVDPYDFDPDDL